MSAGRQINAAFLEIHKGLSSRQIAEKTRIAKTTVLNAKRCEYSRAICEWMSLNPEYTELAEQAEREFSKKTRANAEIGRQARKNNTKPVPAFTLWPPINPNVPYSLGVPKP